MEGGDSVSAMDEDLDYERENPRDLVEHGIGVTKLGDVDGWSLSRRQEAYDWFALANKKGYPNHTDFLINQRLYYLRRNRTGQAASQNTSHVYLFHV